MLNPMQLLRMRNIFPGQQQPSPTFDTQSLQGDLTTPMQPPVPNPMEQQFDPGARMRELYTPETDASQRFETLNTEYPEYQKPGWLRAIAGAISAFGPGGHDTGMKVANFHNDRRMTDWKNRITPAYQAASLERSNNMNERQLAHNTVQNEIVSRRDTERTRVQDEQNRIRDARAKVYEFKARNPNAKIIVQKGGNILAINPSNGQTIRNFGPSGSMTDADKMELEQTYALDRISATGEENRATEATRSTNREELQTGGAWEVYTVPDPNDPSKQVGVRVNTKTGDFEYMRNLPPGLNRPGTTSGRTGELPTQTRVRQFTKARELFNSRPDLKPFITINGNDFQIAAPSAGGMFSKSGPTPEQYEEIVSAIYGNEPTNNTGVPNPGGRGGGPGNNIGTVPTGRGRGVTTPGKVPYSTKNPPPAPPGYKYVPKPGGGWTAVPIGGGQ